MNAARCRLESHPQNESNIYARTHCVTTKTIEQRLPDILPDSIRQDSRHACREASCRGKQKYATRCYRGIVIHQATRRTVLRSEWRWLRLASRPRRQRKGKMHELRT